MRWLSQQSHVCITLPSHRSRNPPGSSPEEEGNGTVEAEVQPPYPFTLSGDDSEEDEQDEATDLPATPWHPKPLGVRARYTKCTSAG